MLSSRKRHPPKKTERGIGKRALLFLIPLLLAIVVIAYVASRPAEPFSAAVGDIAPDFQLQVVGPDGLTGETVRLSSFRGKVVLLEFMVSWCGVCQRVAPALESLREEYEPRGVVFISVAGTQRGANEESTATFIKEYGSKWTYGLDSDNSVFSRYNVEATPTFFIIDANGKVASTFRGVTTTQAFSSALDAALSS